MTVANEVPPHCDIFTAREIDSWLALVVLSVKDFVILAGDVMCLIELD